MASRKPNITLAEQVVAAALVRGGLRFYYEPKAFRFRHIIDRDRGFHPDFFLPDENLYLEVGNPKHKKTKLRGMRGSYPNVRVVIVPNSVTVTRNLLVGDDVTISIDWAFEMSRLFGDEVMDYLTERWVEQEYYEYKSIAARLKARRRHREARITKTVGPSMRDH